LRIALSRIFWDNAILYGAHARWRNLSVSLFWNGPVVRGWPIDKVLFDQTRAEELLGELIDVTLAAAFPETHGNDQHENSTALDPVDDPITLSGGTQASEARHLTEESLALFLRLVGQTIGPLDNLLANPLVRDGLQHSERTRCPTDLIT